ncbi:MAG: DEAD/DEAH box helicase [Candidatus Diapherotrites archaeon]|uniref:DEAD/DEAH box helicase n=1 Tax=Candidatus Iainarchaeum sp. TaxID=3101447 RepID=A0A8T4L2S3_9ARCH|nr:DEAD/DEAH box helicase [Candidatus Diapherotrites archaeon]
MTQATFLKAGAIEPRLYQQVLAAQVLEKGNSLVVAPTALGKTIVAALVANELLKSKPLQKILIVSPTKPLAVQHQETFLRVMDLPSDQIGLLTGSTPPEKRKKIIDLSVIVSATPQVIENDVINGHCSLKNFSLVVFDECHRAVGEYSYVFLAKQFVKQNEHGIILGLTASPGGNSEKIQDVCRNLFIKNVEIKTRGDADVVAHSNQIHMDWIMVDLPESFLTIKGLLREFQKDQLLFLKKLGLARNMAPNVLRRTELLGLQSQIRNDLSKNPGRNPALFSAISKLAALLKVGHAETLLETQGVAAVHEYFEKMRIEATHSGASKALKSLLNDERIQKSQSLVEKLLAENIEHPKQTRLIEVLENQLAEKPDSKIIVFNHYRDSVRGLVRLIESRSNGLKPMRFVGQAARENEKGMTQKEQIAAIDQFRNGGFNVLVGSSVAEEGLDIPSVDLVVFYEPVPSEIRMIQRRGRTGRIQDGKCVRDEAYYWSSQAKEKQMLATLKSMKKTKDSILPQGEKQTTLHKFASGASDKVLVFVDHREQASSVIRELVELGALITAKQLEVGDYVVSDEVCIERKTVEDFLESMIDGRLFGQLVSMLESYRSSFLILEGNIDDLYSLRNIHKNAIMGALSSIAVNYRVPILLSRSAKETAEIVYITAKREQHGKEKDLRIRTGRKGLTTPELQQFVVESFPMVGPTMAKSLLGHFKSIKSIVNASEKELQAVDNMGEKKAKKIVKLINAKFSEETGAEKTVSVESPAEEKTESDTPDDAAEE